jgi:two-component system cell cycle sensor histidine kinase/response regulator CckA
MRQLAAREFPPELTLSGTSSRTTILVVEDDRRVRDTTCEILRMLKYSVLAASDAENARTAFMNHSEEIDLLVCDAVLPEGDGFILAEELRFVSSALKVIVVSGYPQSKQRESQQEFLAKPYTADVLVQKIKALLRDAAVSKAF